MGGSRGRRSCSVRAMDGDLRGLSPSAERSVGTVSRRRKLLACPIRIGKRRTAAPSDRKKEPWKRRIHHAGGSASSTRYGKSRSFVRPVISRLRRLMQAARSILCLRQFAFPRNALMLFVCTFDAIFELAPIVRELFGDFVDPAWHMATDCGP